MSTGAPQVDIFTQIESLFRNKTPEGIVNSWLLHRFLASEIQFAGFARELGRIYDDTIVTEIWRSSLPFTPKPPYFKYVGPKKPPAPDELVKKVADLHGYTTMEAEEFVSLIVAQGKLESALSYYGVEPSAPPVEKKTRGRKKKA